MFIDKEMQKAAHALMGELRNAGYSSRAMCYEAIKSRFTEAMDLDEPFSLKTCNCTVEMFREFMDFMVEIGLDYGIFTSSPLQNYDDIERYVAICMQKKVCCVTGSKHSPDTGTIVKVFDADEQVVNSFTTIDKRTHRRMPLTASLYNEAMALGYKEFRKKYPTCIAIKTDYWLIDEM